MKSQHIFLALIGVQSLHSLEEYFFRLWETFPPARFLSGLVSVDLERGFIVINLAVVALGICCHWWPVRRRWASATLIAQLWVALELVNETVLKLRWAALNLRKTHNLKPIASDAIRYDLVSTGPVTSIDLESLSDMSGLYAFYDQSRPIYAGETDHLKSRISRHLQYGLPCVNLREDDAVTLRTMVVPNMKQAERIHWMMDFVNREHPFLNYQRAA